ncbi:MAG: phosphomannomutase/phosphoglucomutase, partial [Candidatus Kerfeldbacteria bacterium]|nr:phosphomannomutase/phosphoglucomutase [Candidatus Kerfeldbacteria bacterium]
MARPFCILKSTKPDPVTMDEKIFKAYDIRGVVPDQMDGEFAFLLGRSYATMRQKELPGKRMTIAVGGDMRLSTPDLKSKLIEGLTESGADVVDVGLVSTPTFYFSVAFYHYDGGIQVSASHNPKEYNGFKMVRARGVPVSRDTGMDELKTLVQSRQFLQAEGKGKVTQSRDILVDEVREESVGIDQASIRPLTIVVDAANAMGALDIETMFQGLPCKLIKLNFDLDGTFPVHQPDPLDEKNLKIIQDAVHEHHADLGIAPDGDGDRYFFIDDKGDIIRQEILRGIMAQLALKEHPGATVCYDIRPGRITREMIEEAGGHAVVTPVGHSLIKEVMIRENAVFGGESSGHYFYQFSFGTFEAPIRL